VSLFGKNQKEDLPGEDRTPAGGRPLSAPRSQAEFLESKPQPGRAPIAGHGGEEMANIGKSIAIKGDLTGDEDLQIVGNVEGRIDLPNNELTVGPDGKVRAEVQAKSVVVQGHVTGNVTGTEKVELHSSGVVEGDVKTPRLIVQEGAVLNGAVEMGQTAAKSVAPPPPKIAAAGDLG